MSSSSSLNEVTIKFNILILFGKTIVYQLICPAKIIKDFNLVFFCQAQGTLKNVIQKITKRGFLLRKYQKKIKCFVKSVIIRHIKFDSHNTRHNAKDCDRLVKSKKTSAV